MKPTTAIVMAWLLAVAFVVTVIFVSVKFSHAQSASAACSGDWCVVPREHIIELLNYIKDLQKMLGKTCL